MMWVTFFSCILASAFNAGSSLAEREASKKPNRGQLFSKKLGVLVIKDKQFLLGLLLQGLATVMEIVALSQGSLVIVGPLLTLDIIFLWLFITWRYHVAIRPSNWIAAVLVILGLSLFFVSAQPKTGSPNFKVTAWIWASSFVGALIVLAFNLARSQLSTTLKTVTLATATATNYALDAGLAKLVLNQVKVHGLGAIFLGWPLYALLVFAAISIYMTQNTLKSGSLVISQPIIEVVQSGASIIIGVFIFHDLIKHSWLSLTGLSIGFIISAIGISILTRAEKLS